MQKAAVGFLMFVCLSFRLSVRIEQLGSYRVNFHEIWNLSIFRKSVENIQAQLKSDKDNLFFYVLLSAHLTIILVIDQINAKFLLYNKFVIFLSKRVEEYNKLIIIQEFVH